MPEEPEQEMVIALAGPAVNLVLAAAFAWVWLLVDSPVVLVFAALNLGMALFNLLPAYPMDGGRVLRAFLATRMGFVPASKLAHRVGSWFAWAFIGIGLLWPWPTLLLVGAFLLVALRQEHERMVAYHWERTTGRPAPWDTTTRSGVPPSPTTTLWPRSRL
jgi:Zn-dependent protease